MKDEVASDKATDDAFNHKWDKDKIIDFTPPK
jgi:hypothetical protein